MFSMDIWCCKRIIEYKEIFSHIKMLERWPACPSLIVPNRELWNYSTIITSQLCISIIVICGYTFCIT